MGIHDVSMYSVIHRNVRFFGHRVALRSGSDAISYKDLLHKLDALAVGLRALGLRTGERVAVLARNSLEFVYLYGAAARVGAIVLPVNWRLSQDEMEYVLTDGSPAVLFLDPEFHDSAGTLITRLGIPTVSLGAANDLIAKHETDESSGFSQDDRSVIIHTAAVHGRPRGAVITHHGLLLNALNLQRLWNLGQNDVNLAMLPLFHVAGILMILAVMMEGGSSVITAGFDVDQALSNIEDFSATVFFEFPPMLSSLLDKAQTDRRDLASLRHVLGIDHPDTVKRFQEVTGATFWAAYGQSETSGLTTIGSYSERPGSAGRPLQLVDLEVVDESGNVLEPGRSGEIVVRGPQVFKGYWNLEEDTLRTFRDGWHHTGDLGRLDEDGYLWFEGRALEKELIKTGGENVYPSEVENVVRQHPLVKDVAVIGVPDSQWGEAIKAVCVLEPGSWLSEADLIDFVAGKIARFKKPRYVVYVDELPRNASGCVDRNKVREGFGNL
ncbi:MAG: AMP-binding protein [Pseudomonadota bacterium]